MPAIIGSSGHSFDPPGATSSTSATIFTPSLRNSHRQSGSTTERLLPMVPRRAICLDFLSPKLRAIRGAELVGSSMRRLSHPSSGKRMERILSRSHHHTRPARRASCTARAAIILQLKEALCPDIRDPAARNRHMRHGANVLSSLRGMASMGSQWPGQAAAWNNVLAAMGLAGRGLHEGSTFRVDVVGSEVLAAHLRLYRHHGRSACCCWATDEAFEDG